MSVNITNLLVNYIDNSGKFGSHLAGQSVPILIKIRVLRKSPFDAVLSQLISSYPFTPYAF
jgi:hypothetical protein